MDDTYVKKEVVLQHESGVYAIRNVINGKLYIGSTVDFRRRRSHHYSYLQRNVHGNPHLQHAWNTHGKDSFEFLVLERCAPELLIVRESAWVTHYNTMDAAYGYNLAYPERHIVTDAARKKISVALKGRPFTEEHRQNLTKANRKRIGLPSVLKGRAFTGEHRQHLIEDSKKRMGIPRSADVRARISAGLAGKKRTEASRQKQSLTLKSRPHWLRGKSLPLAIRQRISEAKKKQGCVAWNKGKANCSNR